MRKWQDWMKLSDQSCTLIKGAKRCAWDHSSNFIMASMGLPVVGEKITRLFEFATKRKVPVVLLYFRWCSDARGIVSLMQMAKISAAVQRHSENYSTWRYWQIRQLVMTASFAMEGDIIMAESQALVGFCRSSRDQLCVKNCPDDFQSKNFYKNMDL